MFRAAVVAVLAIALSPSIASAQMFVPGAQALSGLGAALAQPEPIEINLIISFDFAELARPVPMEIAHPGDAVDIADSALPELIEHNLIVTFNFAELAVSVGMAAAHFDMAFDIAELALPELIEHSLIVSPGFAELTRPAPMDAATLDDVADLGDFPMPALIEHNLLITFDFGELWQTALSESTDIDVPFVLDLTPTATYSVVVRAETRPSSLKPMYAAQIALQAADLVTTMVALNAGHREMNPLFKSGNRAAMVAAKIASASLDILVAERMWKKNPKGAVLVMIVSNVVMSTIVANNIGVIRGGSR